MNLETNRCKLRTLKACDRQGVLRVYQDEQVRRYLGGPVEEALIKRLIKRLDEPDEGRFATVIEKRTGSFIGMVSIALHHDQINEEVSYQLLPEWWGKGYGKEVVSAVLQYAFQNLHLKKVVAETQAANTRSCRLLESVGMNKETAVDRFGEKQIIYAIYNNDHT
ncbi:GNAT family N-acetyltransferase [Geomicrobium sediminis]|uniref:Ribosomal-protein-alanine N-acetyltransferase n=1 Tax=Geomicrobium sediminis TaxID=1347788 RepID=A0ABS2PFG3_9BACL|nr:GNAT family N-acetyltransferase [Geomicrobium sediminis]MBM7634174.1 ribosomal-protein-alanine N-acetyltransferase [Geomicrobium sediminis]